MKNLKLLSLFVSVLFCQSLYSQADKAGLPEISIKDLTGKTVSTTSLFDGESPVILSFWTTWCSPCIKELNAINDNLEDWQDEANVRFIAISIDDSRSSMRVAPFVNGKGWEFEVFLDPNGDFKRAMNVVNPPHTFIIDKNGEIVYQHTSYAEGDEEELFEQIMELQ